MRKITIFDTTLRDGEQAPGYSMNPGEKLDIAMMLDSMGVDVIEAGMPISSGTDFEAVKRISAEARHAGVAALARLTVADVERAWEAIAEARAPRIHTFIATSDIHLEYKLKMNREDVLGAVDRVVRRARSLCPEVEFSAEDATRSDRDFLCEVLSRAIKSGAGIINIPDTVGYTTPFEMAELIKYVRANVNDIDKCVLSVHCHNDLGLAVANTLAALEAGAAQFECTLNGIGERAGNAAMEEIVMALKTRQDHFRMDTGLDTKHIYPASRLLQSITGHHVAPNKPIVGTNTFAHEAGIHQHGVMNDRRTYEILDPKELGASGNKLIIGKHSGKHAVEQYLEREHISLRPDEVEKLTLEVKRLSMLKKELDERDLQTIINSNFRKRALVYSLERFIINTGTGITSTAVVQLDRHGEQMEDVAKGDGPIDAAFSAVNKITGCDFKLDSYRIQSATEGVDALGVVDVRISLVGRSFRGHGTSTDIVDASLRAYMDAVNRYFEDTQGDEK